MKDNLPLTLFRTKNLINLIDNHAYPEATYFCPFSMLIEAIGGTNLTKKDRLRLLTGAFGFIDGFRKEKNRKRNFLILFLI